MIQHFKVTAQPLNPAQVAETFQFVSERDVVEWFLRAADDDFRFVLAGETEAMMAAIGHPARLVTVEDTQGNRLGIKRFLNARKHRRA